MTKSKKEQVAKLLTTARLGWGKVNCPENAVICINDCPLCIADHIDKIYSVPEEGLRDSIEKMLRAELLTMRPDEMTESILSLIYGKKCTVCGGNKSLVNTITVGNNDESGESHEEDEEVLCSHCNGLGIEPEKSIEMPSGNNIKRIPSIGKR